MTEPGAVPRVARRSGASHLLGVVMATFASFLVVLVLLTARVVSGHDPSLGQSASGSVVLSQGSRSVVRTTASGRVLGPVGSATRSATAAGGAQRVTVSTRTSGGLAGGGERDE